MSIWHFVHDSVLNTNIKTIDTFITITSYRSKMQREKEGLRFDAPNYGSFWKYSQHQMALSMVKWTFHPRAARWDGNNNSSLLLQKWLSRYRLFQTLTHPWFWYILSRETSPPAESMLYWATLLICVSHPSDMLKWGEKKFSNHGRIILIHEGHEPNLWTKWALLSCSMFLLGEI